MNREFDIITDRRHTGSLKWDVGENELPMWVADMDFRAPQRLRDALGDIVRRGIFGYSVVPDEWYDAYINHWMRRHEFKLEKDWLIFATGVVPIISSVVRKLTTPAERVLVQTPVYNIFFNSILNNGRVPVENRLVYDGAGYRIDFADLEQKLSDPQVSMMLLCNPHNPTGQIWDAETLAEIGHLCAKHHVVVVSDEIHCDITAPGHGYVPFASVSDECKDNSVSCISPSKAFNLAGLQTAAALVPNPVLRHRAWRGLNTDEVAEPNAFAVCAAVTALGECADWLDGMREYVFKNRDIAEKYINENIPQLKPVKANATYLMWLDCSAVTDNSPTLAAHIRKSTGLYISDGAQYGGDGSSFLRLNLACPQSTLRDGLLRLRKGIEKFTF